MASNEGRSLFSYQTWVHAVAGATGSVVAMSAFYPLDTVRIRLQLEGPDKRVAKDTLTMLRELISEEGLTTLYRGMVPVLQSLCASNFVYFYTFHGLRRWARGKGNSSAAVKDLLLGSVAGVCNVMITSPLWVVNTRLKMKGVSGSSEPRYSSLIAGLDEIARTEGVAGLWSGALPSLLLVINPAIQFMTYEAVKRRLTSVYGDLPAVTFFAVGAVAKAVATVLTYPIQLVQTRLRHSGKGTGDNGTPPNLGVLQLLLHILKRQGVAGLFRGLEAKLLQTVLTAALMFAVYEQIAKFVLSLLLRTKLPKKI